MIQNEIDKYFGIDLAPSSAKATEEERVITQDDISLSTTSVTITPPGEVVIPNINATFEKMFPQYANAPFEQGRAMIQNEILNQIQIDDTVTMQPQFTVSAPNVNVNVDVDQAGRVTKYVSILNPGQGTLLNNWYSRTSSQYGKTTK